MPHERGAVGSRGQVAPAAEVTAAGVRQPEDTLTLALMAMLA